MLLNAPILAAHRPNCFAKRVLRIVPFATFINYLVQQLLQKITMQWKIVQLA
jgi:hypothetical protein